MLPSAMSMGSAEVYMQASQFHVISPNQHQQGGEGGVIQQQRLKTTTTTTLLPTCTNTADDRGGPVIKEVKSYGKSKSNPVRPFVCEICEESHNNQFRFFEHLKKHYERIGGGVESNLSFHQEVQKHPKFRAAVEQNQNVIRRASNVSNSGVISGGETGVVQGDKAKSPDKKTEEGKMETARSQPVTPVKESKTDNIPQSKHQRRRDDRSSIGPGMVCHKCKRMFRKEKNFNLHVECCQKVPEDEEHQPKTEIIVENPQKKNGRSKKETSSSSKKLTNNAQTGDTSLRGELLLTDPDVKEEDDESGFANVHHDDFLDSSYDDLEEEETEMMYLKSNICPSCDEQCGTKEKLDEHMRDMHPEVLNISSEAILNEKGPKQKKGISSPATSSPAKKQEVLKCTECHRIFNHRNSLVYHIRSHTGERPHKCEFCNKRFFATSALKVHLRLHSGEKPYRCQYCGRDFRQWGDLKYHIISIHSDLRQYQCEFCGKNFARKYSLIVHRRIHTGERNYKCEVCSKAFRAASYLQNHKRIHTGEKPHECPTCKKPFRVRSDMKRHMQSHSRELPTVVLATPVSSHATSVDTNIFQNTQVSQSQTNVVATMASSTHEINFENSQGLKQNTATMNIINTTAGNNAANVLPTAINITLADGVHSASDILQNGVTTLHAATVVQEGMTIYQDTSSMEIINTGGHGGNTVVLLPLNHAFIQN